MPREITATFLVLSPLSYFQDQIFREPAHMNTILSLLKHKQRRCTLSELLESHIDRLYQQAYRYCGSEHDAEDLLQELMIECCQREQQIRDAPVPAAWLSRVLYHRFVDRYRSQRKHTGHDSVDDIEHLPCANDPPLDDRYMHRQMLDAMQSLSAEQKMVINLHDIEGYTLVELSRTTEIPVGTLKSHLHRARKALKKVLDMQPIADTSR